MGDDCRSGPQPARVLLSHDMFPHVLCPGWLLPADVLDRIAPGSLLRDGRLDAHPELPSQSNNGLSDAEVGEQFEAILRLPGSRRALRRYYVSQGSPHFWAGAARRPAIGAPLQAV